jgi:hypothetical protein
MRVFNPVMKMNPRVVHYLMLETNRRSRQLRQLLRDSKRKTSRYTRMISRKKRLKSNLTMVTMTWNNIQPSLKPNRREIK